MASTVVRHADLMKALEILGLDGEVTSVYLGPRTEDFAGLNSAWMLVAKRYVRGREPWTEETVYIPVMLPHDEQAHGLVKDEDIIAEVGGWCVPHYDDIDLVEPMPPVVRFNGA